MKANYKVIANKQKILEKEIENFEPTSTMSVLLMRYSIIQGLLQVKLNEKDANGSPNISPSDMAYDMTTFFSDAVNTAADDFTDDDDDRTIKFDGTVDEFRQELANRVLITLSLAFEHEFINLQSKPGFPAHSMKFLRLNILLMRKTMAVKYPKCSKATALKSTSLRVGTVLQPKTNEVKSYLHKCANRLK